MKNAWKISLLAAALALAAPAWAQVSIEPPASGGGGNISIAPPDATSTTMAAPALPAATAPVATLPSAQSILQDIVSSPGGRGPTTQGSGGPLIAPGPELGPDGLLREGQQIELRNGHLQKEEAGGGAMMFLFDPKELPHYPAMGVVPSRRLAAMEDAAGFGDGSNGSDMNFRITAEVTQYRGKNYLYIKPSGVPVPPPARPVAVANAPLAVPAAPNVPVAAPLPQGNVISLRIARLVKDAKTGAELIAFDADGKLMADPPMGVISCKYLAVMEDTTEYGAKPGKFYVSGEVTTYRGKNYLYLKFVKVVADLNKGIGAGDNPVMAH